MTMQKHYTVDQFAEQMGVPPNKVLCWIDSGDLVAVDTSVARAKRPRWRIGQDSIDSFLESRRSSPIKPVVKSKRSSRMSGVTEFIK